MNAGEYHVEISEPAELEADAIYLWLQQMSMEAAARWYEGLHAFYQKLAFMPYRNPALASDPRLRRTVFRGYRITYRIVEPIEPNEQAFIRILHVHHGSQVIELD